MATNAKPDTHLITKARVKPTAELSTLTPEEQAEFIDTLEPAEAQIGAGEPIDFDPE